MITSRFVIPVLLACVCLQLAPLQSSAAVAAKDDQWLPVDPAQLALAASIVEPSADAEVLHWDIRLQHADNGSTLRAILSHYLRIKIFTERGKEQQSQVDLPYAKNTKIEDIAARTIKSDGSIVNVDPKTVFDRTIVKTGNVKVNAKSFALPAVEPGVIVEYRWKEVRNGGVSLYTRLQFQKDIPVQKIVCHVKPYNSPSFPYGMRTQMFHGQTSGFVKEDGGFYTTTMEKVPAFREEPHMPPEDQVRPWMLVFYAEDTKATPEKYWPDFAKQLYDLGKSSFKVNDDIKKALPQIVGDAQSPEQKIERIYEFCRTKIKNTSDDASGLTDEEREKLPVNNNSWDTLKRGQGTGSDVNQLFGSLATAAGFEARYAALPDRGDHFFDPGFPDSYFISALDVAVKLGDSWQIVDPGSAHLPYGTLIWREEGQKALIADQKAAVWVDTPMTPPAKSVEKRTGTFKLAADGTLTGDVTIEFTGQLNAIVKEFYDDESPEQRERYVIDEIKKHLPAAELSGVRVENVTDPNRNVVFAFSIRVPGYAQRTGKRLFLQPSFFTRGEEPRFKAAERKHMVYFNYPWSEEDHVTIDLPAGFKLDNAEAPMPFNAGAIGAYEARIFAMNDSSQMQYKRKFFFCGDDSLYFPAAGYAQLKRLFDAIHEQDNHTISLKADGGAK